MRYAMEVRKTFFAVNVVSLGLLAVGGLISGSVVAAYYPAPRVSSVAGIDSSIDADSFRDGVPLRVRSGRPISVSLDAGKPAGPIELMVRSSRIGDDGKRKPVLLLAPGERPASSVRTFFASGIASFIYVSDDGSTRGDVLELGVLKASRLIAWYPLHLSVVQPGGEQ
jgi:hypothetical protein